MLVCVYLSLCDDVEGAALLALPDDVLPLVIVLLMCRGGEGGRGGGGVAVRTEASH